MKIILASKSDIKRTALESFLETYKIPYSELICIAVNNPNIPNQPVNSAEICAEMRLDSIDHALYTDSDLLIAIENGIEVEKEWQLLEYIQDICVVAIRYGNYTTKNIGRIRANFLVKYYEKAVEQSESQNELGISVTVGSIITREYHLVTGNRLQLWNIAFLINRDRVQQIQESLSILFTDKYMRYIC